MTLSTSASRVSYAGPSGTGPYLVPFRFLEPLDLRVTRRSGAGMETPLVYGADYTVDGALESQGRVTLASALAAGETLTIRRAPAYTQPTGLWTHGPYYRVALEEALDRIVMQIQALSDEVGRAPRLGESVAASVSTIGRPASAGQVVATNPRLDGFTLATLGTTSDVALPGEGRTVPTLSAYLANNALYNVRDFGAVGDGRADDTAPIQAAIDAARRYFAAAGAAATVLVPAGRYRVTRSLDATGTHARFMHIRGEGRRISVIIGTAAVGAFPILDCVDSNGSQISDISIIADTTCYLGILHSRQGAGSSGTHKMTRVEVYGNFTRSCVYRVSAEETTYLDCELENTITTGGRALTLVAVPEARIASAYVRLGEISGGNTVHRIIGGRYIANYTGRHPDQRAMYIRAARSVSIHNAYVNAGTSDAAIDIGASHSSIDTVVVEGSPAAAVLIPGSCTGLAIRNCYLGSAVENRGVRITNGGEVSQLTVEGSSGSGVYLLETASGTTLKNSRIELGERAAIVAGASKNNRYAWDGAQGNTGPRLSGTSANDELHSDHWQTWRAAPLRSGWVDYGASAQGAEYRRTPDGSVEMRGTIRGGARGVATVLFALPTGYRPAKRVVFPVDNEGATGALEVLPSGDVRLAASLGSAGSLSLNGVRFPANA